MQTYLAGTDVTVLIPFKDLNGAAVVPTGLSYRISGQGGDVLLADTVLPLPSGNEVSIDIDGSINEIVDLMDARVVTLSMTTDVGTIAVEHVYLLAKPARLAVMVNSFQTMAQAHLEAAQMPNLIGWNGATDLERATAMIEAFRRLTRLGYRIRRPEDLDAQNVITDFVDTKVIEPRLWPLIDEGRWLSNLYTDEFRRALRCAQVAEANEILRGDRVNEKRRAGLLSETIGESSMMFRVGKPLDLGLSAAALQYVTGFVQMRMTLTRS